MIPYIVFLSKSFDVWKQDAQKWMDNNNINVPDENILSEPMFHTYLSKGIIGDSPVYFVKDVITHHLKVVK